VVLDVADGGAVVKQPNAGAPVVLPIAYNATTAELAAARKQYRRVLKGPVKSQSFLSEVDDALAAAPQASKAEGSSFR
jgi:hypothetical protein